DKLEYFKSSIIGKSPFVYYIDSLNTAVLTVNSFSLDPDQFKSKLNDLFKSIRKKKSSNLVIDVRQNDGGYGISAIDLISFLIHEPSKQIKSGSVVTNVLPEKKYIIHTMSDYKQFFASNFDTIKVDDRWRLKEEHIEHSKIIPHKKAFDGTIYVLIGGRTYSAGATVALSAKNTDEMIVVGEEAGGGYYFNSGNYFATYELPNSKIMVRIPLMKIDHFVSNNSVLIGSGVLPDIQVPLTVQDLIEGRDSQLDYVLKQINKK
ncbi:MAG: hypothetical protein JKY30_12535, partial [Flavobacteriales bacterium]|nr:hypothetical protein [Flavobacteriales bacterium]